MNLESDFERVTRPLTHYVFLERRGPFAEVAPQLWNELLPTLQNVAPQGAREYLGFSGIDRSNPGEEAMIYQAGGSFGQAPNNLPARLKQRSIKSGAYARFLLTGPYAQIWRAFDRNFKTLAEKQVLLRPEFCIENYLNNPEVTPEDELKTELLVPIAK